MQEACWLEAEGGEEPVGTEGGGAGRREWCARVTLGALGVSLVGRAPPAELLYAVLGGVRLDLEPHCAALAVQHMQWDNQVHPHTMHLRLEP